MLTRLCVLSFANQGVMSLLYLLGIPSAMLMRTMDPDELESTARLMYGGMLQSEQLEAMSAFFSLLREHGVALMTVFALRTLARFIGALRMWRLKADGFHIYTSAQLLGILVPMLIAGSGIFNLPGLLVAVLWCFLYWTQRKSLTA